MKKLLYGRNTFGAAVAAGLLCVLLSACGGSSKSTTNAPPPAPPTPTPPASPTVPASKHVVLVMEENQEYSTVAGNAGAWPNLNELIGKGALATNYFADTHPSIGNYFMLTTGQVLTNDDSSTTVQTADNIARHMLAANVSFKVYAEGIANGYVGGDTGLYVVRHDPFALLSDVASTPAMSKQVIWPFTQFATDLKNNALPEFSFIVPDVNDDAHNGTPQQADAWLQTNLVAPLSSSNAFVSGGDGILIVDFDEGADSDTANGGGHVTAAFWGPKVQVAYTQTSKTIYQHESLLATVMAALGLPSPPGKAATAPLMTEFFLQPK